MTAMERDYTVLGRLLSDLIANGLMRVNYQGKDALRICGADGKQSASSLRNILDWMLDEGYIRVEQANRFHNTFHYVGVNLTSKAIAAIQLRPAGGSLRGSIEEAVDRRHLEAGDYAAIGRAFGSLAGWPAIEQLRPGIVAA